MKVLIVEDEKTMAHEMAAFLQKAFYLCEVTHTGNQAIKCMEENPYDFILLDLGLPDKDGLQVLRETRKYVLIHLILFLRPGATWKTGLKALISVPTITWANRFRCWNCNPGCKLFRAGNRAIMIPSWSWVPLTSTLTNAP
ncbi:MAG: response regulator [Chitinophagaceae bacterium]